MGNNCAISEVLFLEDWARAQPPHPPASLLSGLGVWCINGWGAHKWQCDRGNQPSRALPANMLISSGRNRELKATGPCLLQQTQLVCNLPSLSPAWKSLAFWILILPLMADSWWGLHVVNWGAHRFLCWLYPPFPQLGTPLY
jgi:hypothetical protein